jgi:hypothetical protein
MQQETLKNTYIDLSDNLEFAWNIYLGNWRTYLVFLLVINLPLAIVSALIPQPTAGSTPAEFNPLLLVFAAVNGILSILLNLAISILTEKNIFEQNINAQSALKKSLPKLPIGVIVGLLFFLIIFIGLTLFVIPGIYMVVIFAFCTPAIALRNCQFNAFQYSYNLVKGKWWKVFGRLLQLVIALLILSLLFFTIPSIFLLPLLTSFPIIQGVTQVILALISSLIGYFFITAFTVYFLNLDYFKHGLPLKA